jgi:hypothetical protein
MVGDLLKMGYICAPWTEFPVELGQTKDAESMNNVFLRFYQRAEALGSKGGRWCTEI